MYGDLSSEPQLGRDYLNISSNHFYVYVVLSFLGFLSHYNDRKLKLIIIYLFSLSVVLEFLHLIIPGRTFQIPDLTGNILGVSSAGI